MGQAVGGASDRCPAVVILRCPGEEQRRLRQRALPRDDQAVQFLVDRDQGLTFHLVIEVAQVGCLVGVEDDAVVRQPQRVRHAKPAADQDHRDQPVGVVVPLVEVVDVFDLGHYVFRQRPRQEFWSFRVVLAEQHRGGRQRGRPTVDPNRVQERVQLADMVAMPLTARHLGVEICEVTLQQVSIDIRQLVDTGPIAECRESGQ